RGVPTCGRVEFQHHRKSWQARRVVHVQSFPSLVPSRQGLTMGPTTTGQTVDRKDFPMTENTGRDRENSRRETEKMRAESIVLEMASAVRVIGGDGPALAQNNRAARETRLPVTVVERLR